MDNVYFNGHIPFVLHQVLEIRTIGCDPGDSLYRAVCRYFQILWLECDRTARPLESVLLDARIRRRRIAEADMGLEVVKTLRRLYEFLECCSYHCFMLFADSVMLVEAAQQTWVARGQGPDLLSSRER